MISKPELGTILNPLEKRFKKLTNEQADIYHERLKFMDGEVLKDAVIHLVDRAKVFPSPGDIRDTVRDKNYERAKLGKVRGKDKGCPQCFNGYVYYEKPRATEFFLYVGDCAYCHKGEVSITPHLIQRNNEVLFACEKFVIDGQAHYRANPDIEEPYLDASPIHTSEWLKEYFHGPSMFTPLERIPTYKPRRF